LFDKNLVDLFEKHEASASTEHPSKAVTLHVVQNKKLKHPLQPQPGPNPKPKG
jgi:hypothetical protein